MNTVLNKTSYQDFKKPLILSSGVWGVLPSVVFLGWWFCFHSLPGSSLLGKYGSSFKVQTKRGLFRKEKFILFVMETKMYIKVPNLLVFHVSPSPCPLLGWILLSSNSNEKESIRFLVWLLHELVIFSSKTNKSSVFPGHLKMTVCQLLLLSYCIVTLLLLQSYMLFFIDVLFVVVTHNVRFAIKQCQVSQCLQKKMQLIECFLFV